MAFGEKFKSGAAQAPAQNRRVARKSKYAGIKAAHPRDPMPHVGVYRMRIGQCSEGDNPGKGRESFKIPLTIVQADEKGLESHAVGDTCMAVFLTSGDGATAGLGRVKTFSVSAAGFEEESEFDAADPEGAFIDASVGEANALAPGATGRLVDLMVTKGKSTADGLDYYREYHWAAVSEEEQEVPSPFAAE